MYEDDWCKLGPLIAKGPRPDAQFIVCYDELPFDGAGFFETNMYKNTFQSVSLRRTGDEEAILAPTMPESPAAHYFASPPIVHNQPWNFTTTIVDKTEDVVLNSYAVL